MGRTMHFLNRQGLRLIADVMGDAGAPPVLLLHGGGQTRGSWRETMHAIAEAGFLAIAPDARGHGESDPAIDGDYSMSAMSDDLRDIVAEIGGRPALVGASMGGIVALIAAGEAPCLGTSAITLVDVSPRVNPQGRERVISFMLAGSGGFDTLDEVADAIAAYNDNRRRPAQSKGLRRNLREIDGRYFWHWDPMFLQTWDFGARGSEVRVERAARAIDAPILLVHAGRSDIVREEEVVRFRAMLPRAEYFCVEEAGHMVAGDQNEAFSQAVLDFLIRFAARAEPRSFRQPGDLA